MWVDIKGLDGYIISNFGRVINKKTGEEEIQRTVGERRDTATVQPYVNGIRKTYSVGKLVGESFEVPNPTNSKMIYHLGDRLNNRIDNLTYDKAETEAYIKEQERIKEEQARLEQARQTHKEELFNYIENNKEFLSQAKEMNKEISLKDVYDKLCEILEVLKDERK